MGRGRKPATLKLHPAVLADGAPPPKPAFIEADPVASAEFDRVVSLLAEKLTPADAATLAMYASSYSTVARVRAELQTAPLTTMNESSGVVKSHPLLNTLSSAERSTVAFAETLGLTPGARARIPSAPAKVQDDLATFLAKG